MTNPFTEAATKDVWYPDELHEVGTVELISEEPIPADDVPHDDAQYGQWIEVESGTGEMWFSCPKDLSRALGEAEAVPGHVFSIRSAEKGDSDHSPWSFEVAHDPEEH